MEFKRPGYRIVFVTSADALECTCIYEPGSGLPLTLEDLRRYLAETKIQEGIDENALNKLLADAEAKAKE